VLMSGAMRPSELPVSHHTARINGLDFHYVEAGKGPLVVLLHGFPESWWSWRRQLLPLAEAGFRVVAPDQRGYGDSAKQGPYDLDTLSSDVCGLIRHLGAEQAQVVGHDWGAVVAWHLAMMKPGYVERVVAINGPHPAKMQEAILRNPRQALRSWYILAFQLPLLPEALLQRAQARGMRKMYARSAAHITEEELAPFIEGMRQPGAARGMLGWYRTAFREALKRRGRAPYSAQVDAEALIIWGKKDAALDFEAVVPGTQRYAPRLELQPIPDGGHFVHEERPEEVNALLTRFLRGGEEVAAAPKPVGAEKVFDVVLTDAGDNKIAVIREVRMMTGLSLKDAREQVETPPLLLKEGASLNEAARLKVQLANVGATVEVR